MSEANDIPGLLNNIYADLEKKEQKLPSLEAEYSHKKAYELLGKFPLHRKKVFNFLKKVVDAITCKDCNGSGFLEKRDDDGYRLDCPNCMSGIMIKEPKNGDQRSPQSDED